MKAKYANPRRSMISDEEIGDYDKEALIREEYMVVTVTHDGYIKRLPPSTYRAQNRGGRGIAATNTKEGDFLEHMFVALTHDYILFFTDKGKVYWLKVYDLPLATRTAGGRAIVNLLQLGDGERITGMIPVREFHEDECLLMVTRRGTVKKTELTAFKPPAGPRDHRAGPRRETTSSSAWPGPRRATRSILSTREGMAIRFDESRRPLDGPAGLRRQGDRPGRGRRGRRHGRGQRRRRPGQPPDRLRQGLRQADPADRVPLAEPRRQGPDRHQDDRPQRARSSPIAKVTDADEVMLTTSGGMVIRTPVDRHPHRSAATPRASA